MYKTWNFHKTLNTKRLYHIGMYSTTLSTRRRRMRRENERCWYFIFTGWFCIQLASIFAQPLGSILQKMSCFCKNKSNTLKKISTNLFIKEGDEEGSAMKEHSLHSSNCPRLNFLMKFSVLSKMQNVTEQISKSAGKLFLFASSPFCFTFAQLPAFKWVQRGAVGALTRSSI